MNEDSHRNRIHYCLRQGVNCRSHFVRLYIRHQIKLRMNFYTTAGILLAYLSHCEIGAFVLFVIGWLLLISETLESRRLHADL